jgi:hypothetical protein
MSLGNRNFNIRSLAFKLSNLNFQVKNQYSVLKNQKWITNKDVIDEKLLIYLPNVEVMIRNKSLKSVEQYNLSGAWQYLMWSSNSSPVTEPEVTLPLHKSPALDCFHFSCDSCPQSRLNQSSL